MSGRTVKCKLRGARRRKLSAAGQGDAGSTPKGRVPRISRLMALAVRFDQLIRDGVVADQAELARVGRVSRARLTQIMDLLQLAPEIQEDLLTLPSVERGRDRISERDMRPIAALSDWRRQRKMWTPLGRELCYTIVVRTGRAGQDIGTPVASSYTTESNTAHSKG